MKKTYITFGQVHTHSVGGKTLDKDSVAVINHTDEECGRAIAFELFGPEFFTSYTDEQWEEASDILEYFPRGLIEVN